MSKSRVLWVNVGVLLIVASLVTFVILLRLPIDVRGEVSSAADVVIATSEKDRGFVVGLSGIKALRLPAYEVEVDGLNRATIQYRELGSADWSPIPGVTWLNVVPKPEVNDSQPGVFIHNLARANATQKLDLHPRSGSIETLKLSSDSGGAFLALSGHELSLAGQLHLSSDSPSERIHLEIMPTTGYLTIQFINAPRNEIKNLSQITAMQVVQDRASFDLDLRPALFSRWDFAFPGEMPPEASWTLRFDKPLRIVTLECRRAKAGKMQVGNSASEPIDTPTDLDVVGTELNVEDAVKVDPTGITLALGGTAATVTKNKRNMVFRVIFESVTTAATMIGALITFILGLVLTIIQIRDRARPVKPEAVISDHDRSLRLANERKTESRDGVRKHGKKRR